MNLDEQRRLERRRQISRESRARARARQRGEDAPLRKRGPPKLGRTRICKHCGISFLHETKRDYCDAHRAEAKAAQIGTLGRNRMSPARPSKACEQCGSVFVYSPSQQRKFCSYQCHLDSGGAQRAGKAAGSMTRKYGAKKDANHAELVGALRKLGASVLDLSGLGSGIPDLVVWCAERYVLVDIKNRGTAYGRRGLNKNQKEWADGWSTPVFLVYDTADVEALVKGEFGKIKRYPEDRADPKQLFEMPEFAVLCATGKPMEKAA
jgi:hypothetical protein